MNTKNTMKKYKKFTIILLLICSVNQLFSQNNRTIKGNVTDENGDPLEAVVVIGDEGDVFTLSDNKGQFSIKIKFSDIVLIEKEGYNTKQVLVEDLITNSSVVLTKPEFLMGEKDMLQMPFRQLARKRTTGSVAKVNVEKMQNYDSRQGLGAALNGRISGLYGSTNIWGRGNAVVVVDGVPRSDNFDFNLIEIESITVLKDMVTRSMYGALGDAGVIMVTTKRGKAFTKELNFQGEYGVSVPIENTYPAYMNASDYMENYNTIFPDTYSENKIQDTRAGINPALNPDLDFYSNEFLKSQTDYINIFGESSGGNENAQYYLNLGWQHSNGWMKLGDQDTRDKFNVRGNVDYQLTDNFKMKLDAVALFNIQKTPNITDFWKQASEILPNSYPLYWDPALITDSVMRDELLNNAVLTKNGMLLGGDKTYTRNIYGDLTRNGNRIVSERNLQVNIGAEWDLKSLLPGLKANGYLAIDTYNTLVKSQNSKYAVYNPILLKSKVDPTIDSLSVEVIGEDVLATNYEVQNNEMDFYRRLGMFANLTYDQTFGKTDVSMMAVAYRDQTAYKAAKQEIRNLTFGLNGNIMHDNKYLIDFSLGWLGTQKLSSDNRYSFAPSLGLGWILSEEDFMSDSKFLDFFKLRASAGILKNDHWDDYFLYKTAFNTGATFNYNNGINSNSQMDINTRGSNIGWQKRKEFVFGFDASMFNNSLWFEGSAFYTEHYDLITKLDNLYPLLLGTESIQYYGNYNAESIKGVEFGIKYDTKISKDIFLTLGSNLVGSVQKQTKIDEPFYTNDYQYRSGTATNAIWGFSSEGLYGNSDFDVDGNLLSSLPIPSWGQVAPGDIKYIDMNNDNQINSEDVHIIGQKGPSFQYSLYFNLKIKQFEFYALYVGQNGGDNMRTGNYHRTYGDLKYPEHLKQAYSATNPDVNAAYPRLTTIKSAHNFQDSDFWMYSNNWFTLPVMQLTYTFTGKSESFVNNAKVYLRGTDLFIINNNAKYTDVSVGNVPKTQGFSVGSILSF